MSRLRLLIRGGLIKGDLIRDTLKTSMFDNCTELLSRGDWLVAVFSYIDVFKGAEFEVMHSPLYVNDLLPYGSHIRTLVGSRGVGTLSSLHRNHISLTASRQRRATSSSLPLLGRLLCAGS